MNHGGGADRHMRRFRTSTAFEQRVYDLLRRVPAGQVTTYAALARALGCRSPRAVGQALRRNPFAPAVPCHRVIRSDGTLGGFEGRTDAYAIRCKRARLEAEGVRFVNGRFVGDPFAFEEKGMAKGSAGPNVARRLRGTAPRTARP